MLNFLLLQCCACCYSQVLNSFGGNLTSLLSLASFSEWLCCYLFHIPVKTQRNLQGEYCCFGMECGTRQCMLAHERRPAGAHPWPHVLVRPRAPHHLLPGYPATDVFCSHCFARSAVQLLPPRDRPAVAPRAPAAQLLPAAFPPAAVRRTPAGLLSVPSSAEP